MGVLRGMVKSRRESVELYRQGNRPELAAKEEAEIAVIEGFLPRQMDPRPPSPPAVDEAVAETGATGPKDMGRVMAALKAKHAAALDLAACHALGEGAARRLMALPPAFLDELRARTPMAALVGAPGEAGAVRQVVEGLLPVPRREIAIFYVYDDGYHCFGCGAHGDAIGFVMQTEGAGFIEAVERAGRGGRAGRAQALARSRGSGTRAARPHRRAGPRGGVLHPAAACAGRGGRRWPICAAGG